MPHTVLLELGLILATARLFGELAERLRQPTVVGELLAGVALGPSVLNWVAPSETLQTLAEVGVILLLFEAGIGTDFRRLARTGRKSAVVAIGGFVLPFVLAWWTSRRLFALELSASLLIAGTLTATSIGITVRILSDLKRSRARESVIVLGAAVLDDILGVVLLAVLYGIFVGGELRMAELGRLALLLGLFFLAAPLVAKILSVVVRRLAESSRRPGIVPTALVSLVLFLAWLAHLCGAPDMVGGFAAGLALSRRFYLPFGIALSTDAAFSRRIERRMKPILHLFTPIFFVAVGVSLDLRSIEWTSSTFWLLSLVLTAVAIVGKLGGAMLLREPLSTRLAVGVCMVPRGEVGLIFAEMGRSSGVIASDTYAVLVMVIAYTTLLAPFWVKLFYRRFGHSLQLG